MPEDKGDSPVNAGIVADVYSQIGRRIRPHAWNCRFGDYLRGQAVVHAGYMCIVVKCVILMHVHRLDVVRVWQSGG